MTTLNPDPHAHLKEPGTSTSFSAYSKQLWATRHYAKAEARGRLEAGHAENALGRLWLLIEPILFIAIYFFMFGVLLDAERGLANADFLSYLAVGKITFGFMRRGVNGAAGSLSSDQALAASTFLPRAVYPLAQLFKSELAYRYELIVMIAFVMLRGIRPQLTWLLVPLIGLLTFAFCFGAGLIMVRMISNFADLRSALPQVLLFLMYTSGVIFPIEQFIVGRANDTLLLRLMAVNPFYALVKVQQWAVMDYTAPEMPWVTASALLWGLVLPFAGLAWFIRAERRYSSAIYSG